jgi:hypothetical protein
VDPQRLAVKVHVLPSKAAQLTAAQTSSEKKPPRERQPILSGELEELFRLIVAPAVHWYALESRALDALHRVPTEQLILDGPRTCGFENTHGHLGRPH